MIDQRAFPRVRLELKAGYARSGATAGRLLAAVTRDVSRGGFLAETPSYEPFAGDFLGQFRLPGEETPVGFGARVVWSRGAGRVRRSGCAFTRIDPADRRRLEAFLAGVSAQLLTVY